MIFFKESGIIDKFFNFVNVRAQKNIDFSCDFFFIQDKEINIYKIQQFESEK